MEIPLVVLFLTPHTYPPDGSGHGSCLRCWKNACEWRGIFLRHELAYEFIPPTAARRRGVRGLTAGARQARPLVCLLPCQSVRGAPSFWWPPWTPLGVGSETWWWCGPFLPRGSPLCVLLTIAAFPRSRVGISHVVNAEPQIRCLIFQLWLEGCTAQCCVSWQRGTVTGSSLIRQGGLAARMGLHASLRRRAVRVVRLEDAVAKGRRSWPVF